MRIFISLVVLVTVVIGLILFVFIGDDPSLDETDLARPFVLPVLV